MRRITRDEVNRDLLVEGAVLMTREKTYQLSKTDPQQAAIESLNTRTSYEYQMFGPTVEE